MKFTRYAALALLSAALGWGIGHWTQPAHSTADTGPVRAPEFQLIDLNGNTHSTSDYAGKLLMINFWATWCGPCLKEVPRLEAAYTQHAAHGFSVLGPALDDSATVSAFVHEQQVSYPVTIGDQSLFALMDAFGDTLGALPFTVLIDRAGWIVERHWGELSQGDLDEMLKKYL